MTFENNSGKGIGLDKIGSVGLVIGVIGAALVGFGIFSDPKATLPGYMFGYIFWLTIAVAFLALTLLHHIVRGAWGLSILRLLEAGGGTMTWIIMGILFLPIAAKLPDVYKWADAAYVAKDHLLQNKQWWLNPTFFYVRIAFYIIFFAWIANAMRRSSLKQDETGEIKHAHWRTNVSSGLMPFFIILVTLAYTDIAMSLEAHWFSSIYGLIFLVGGALGAMAICNMIVMSNAEKEPYATIVNKMLSKDLGNWMYVFTLLWAYFSFSQYVITYSGNLPEFNIYYLMRQDVPYVVLGFSLMIGQFLIPFVTLMSPKVKATPKLLVRIAIWIFVFRVLDTYWQIIPNFREEFKFQWQDLAGFLMVGGWWMFAFGRQAASSSVLPTHDPRLVTAYEHA